MRVVQPFYLRVDEAPELPFGWKYLTTEAATTQLKPGKLFDKKTARTCGRVPVLSQGEADFIGFHDEAPGVFATEKEPVVTFANHTCAMRLMTNPFSCIQNIFPKVGKDGEVDTRYFFYAARGRVNLTDYKGHHPLFRQALIPVPPLSTQRCIASILGAYDDLIEVNRRRIAVLEEIARGMFEEWFVRFRFPSHEALQILDTPDGPLPEGWAWGAAADIIAFDPKTPVPRDGSKPFISMGHLDTAISLIAPPDTRDGNSGTKFRNGDTLFARITPCLENGKTGLVSGLPGPDGIGFGSTEFIVMRGTAAGPAFAYCLARQSSFRNNARNSMSGATGRQRARTESLASFAMPVPALDVLRQFDEMVWPMLELVGRLGAANAKLASSRDLLLPRLISGQLSVTEAERELEEAA